MNRLLRSIAVNENVEKKRTEQSASVEEYVDEIMQELQRNGEDGRYKARR
ncbi:MAG: hypothetical protein V8S95_00595 [Odoribacter sp.]